MKRLTSILFPVFVLSFWFLSACGDEEELLFPIASFSFDAQGKTVTFTNLSEHGDSFIWEFGDGKLSTEESPSYTYSEVGEHKVKLTVTNGDGLDTEEETIRIVAVLPEADFSLNVDGRWVTLSNESQNAETYLWDFGDGSNSTEQSPSITYSRDGSYMISLTATNDNDSSIKTVVIDVFSPIAIDGVFNDWKDIEEVYTGSGTISKLKVDNSGNNLLYLYVEGSDQLSDLTQIFLNLDNDKATGAFTSWLYTDAGEDVLIEGKLPSGVDQFGSVYTCLPCDGSRPYEWNWSPTSANDNIDSFIKASSIVSLDGGKAYELEIYLKDLSANVQVSGDGIGLAVLDLSINTWSPVGAAPDLYNENDNPNATLIDYIFK